ncbi:hypothetical protein [Dactylosporangium sp. CA-092794]
MPTIVPGDYRLLQARVNDRFVTAEADGVLPLIANRAATGIWEQFTRITA